MRKCDGCGVEISGIKSKRYCSALCYQRVWSRNNRDRIRVKHRLAMREYGKLEKYKALHRAKSKKWINNNKIKVRAHIAVKRAVDSGELIKPRQCTDCNSNPRVNAHHPDYSKPLDVLWLCSLCHKKEHLRMEGTIS